MLQITTTMERCLQGVLLLIVVLQNTVQGYDLDIRTDDKIGSIVFNASHSIEGWRYSFDWKKSDNVALQITRIDPKTGLVSLTSQPQCWYLSQNPVLLYIEAQRKDLEAGTTSFSQTPLHLNIRGLDCFPKRRKNHPLVMHEHRTQQIVTELAITYDTCLEKLSHVAYLPHYIPRSFSQCAIEYRLKKRSVGSDLHMDGLGSKVDHRHFLIDRVTGEVRTAEEVCFTWPFYVLHGKIDLICNNDDDDDHSNINKLRRWNTKVKTTDHENVKVITVPFKLLLYGKDKASWKTKPESYTEVMHQATTTKIRNRRQTMNTPPTFPQRQYMKPVLEGLPVGTIVAKFTAADPDSGPAGVLTYSLVASRDGRSQNMFEIDASTGEVKTTVVLDRESIDTHYFSVIATDNGRPAQQAMASLMIPVEDVNDHAPRFESQYYAHSISESVSIGSTVITVRASDEDAGKNSELEYSILNPGGVNDVFRIESGSGSITTRLPLDRERIDFYTLQIQATDKAVQSERKTSTAIVELTILDENDNYPQFSKSSYTVDVSEDIDPMQQPIIAEIKATDMDASLNGKVRYSITGGNTRDTFKIDQDSGQLSVTKALDYDSIAKDYRINVRAQDSGSPPRSNSTTVLVRVIDVNDNSPYFYSPSYHESVLENDALGSTVTRVQAYDNDDGLNGKLIYSLINTPPDLPLEIDRATGVITVKMELDRERQARYEFKVQARDQGEPERTATAGITIVVRDVNDNAPIFHPKVYEEMVSEEAIPGTRVVTVTASDADEAENARVSYLISGGNVGGAFNIIGNMGQGLITVSRALNYKEQNRYVLTIMAEDTGGLYDEATVIVNVSDANTYRPMFQGTPYILRIPEDTPVGTSVFKVVASDEDTGENARISYSIADNHAFQVNPSTGDISIKVPLDREETWGYTLSVTATDHGRPSQSDTVDMEIIVQDVNDNFPKFLESIYEGEVYEDTFIQTSILTISATDEDDKLNGNVRYTFEGGESGDGDFILEPTLGILRTGKELDHERKAEYNLIAFAVDRGVPEKSTSVSIHIKIRDVNDNAPSFESDPINATIPENSPIGTTIFPPLLAVDPDTGLDTQIEYSIVGGPDFDSFSLVTRKNEAAILTTLVELDYESGKTLYTVKVRAASLPLFKDVTVNIYVADQNDNIPILQDFVIVFNNFLNHFPTGTIGKIPAFDPDVSDRLSYQIISGNQANLLHLNKDTGELKLDSRLNSDVPTNGTLQVSVTDGINEVRATCRLFVRLVTENMLLNSVTLRLGSLDQRAFLSPLYDRFVTALASIVPTTEDNVFVIDVRDDDEVEGVGLKVLNVSLSVRTQAAMESGARDDQFMKPHELKERIYLQRALLNKLSTLEVLPFDDNLCVREPCLNFEECLTVLRFGNATAFVDSPTMLFRPIQPVNSFKCECPMGFTGMELDYMCDTEVNLCYSSPCRNNGTCVRQESGYSCDCKSGFTGRHCELESKNTKYTTCPANVCKAPSQCSPLIRSGFRCEICLTPKGSPQGSPNGEECVHCGDLEHYTEFCALTTRSFPRGSFLMFPSLKRRHRFNIELEFATRAKDALLLYNGRYNERHDFIALEILNGQLQFSFSLGTSISRVSASLKDGGPVNDGEWHTVNINYLNRTVTLSVGDDCDVELAIQHGGGRLADSSTGLACASRATQFLEERCSDVTATCHRFLDLTGPLQLGGLPTLPTAFQVSTHDFDGCMRHIAIDGEPLDLNDNVWNNGTEAGCARKVSHCQARPCQHGGTCIEAWGRYKCQCPEGRGGMDCSHAIEPRVRLSGDGYLLYENHGLEPVQLPWYNALSFRTRAYNAILMLIELRGFAINVQLVDGSIHYILPQATVIVDSMKVNDGEWHYFEARWLNAQLVITLDYGEVAVTTEMDRSIVGLVVGDIMVGGQADVVGGVELVHNGLVGCVENVRVGQGPNSLLTDPQKHNTESGCEVSSACAARPSPCPANAVCTDHWGEHTCTCKPGYMGPLCKPICETSNPCAAGSVCRRRSSSSTFISLASTWPQTQGYECACGKGQAGPYCRQPSQQTCPSTWYGHPICGPCNCDKDRGFDPSCHRETGVCSCKEHHYQLVGSDECLPCNCYIPGSYNQSCDNTGQCQCRSGVIGKGCDACPSRFAEVTIRGCEVIYDSCPRAYAGGIWWRRTEYGTEAQESCPRGTLGTATRNCTEEGWKDPKLFSCVSVQFSSLQKQLESLESSTDPLRMNTFLAKKLTAELNEATQEVHPMFASDILVTARLVTHVLNHENAQTGLNLTHSQDKNFIHNVVSSIGRILDLQYTDWWAEIHAQEAESNKVGGAKRRRRSQRGEGPGVAEELMMTMEKYAATLARNMGPLFTAPFDQVQKNIVLGVDYMEKSNITELSIPKYNNKVQNPNMTDKSSHIVFPTDNLKKKSMKDMVNEMVGKSQSSAMVGYVIFTSIGSLLPKKYDEDTVRLTSAVPQEINTPVFCVSIIDDGTTVSRLNSPVKLKLKQTQAANRTGAQCVAWKQGKDGMSGAWSAEGCQFITYEDDLCHNGNSCRIVTCECDHLSSYAVLMDVSSIELGLASVLQLEYVTYAGLGVAILCLLVALVLFCCLRSLESNANSIHINLVFTLLVANVLFIVGINRVEPRIACNILAIFLHFFYMCTFAWLFVEVLHLYRQLSEIRNINHGSMKFYYVLGYVLPGIIVGLAVGLQTDAYGNSRFCWVSTRDVIIWSLAGPVLIVLAANFVILLMSLREVCRKKKAEDPDASRLKAALVAAVFLIPLMALAGAFAVLSSNEDVSAFHYLFAVFTVFEALFILAAYIIFSKRTRMEIRYVWGKMRGQKSLEDVVGAGHRGANTSRSALSYHNNDSSLEGGLFRANVGVSTNSTTSRSTDKSGNGIYRPDGYIHNSNGSSSISGEQQYGGPGVGGPSAVGIPAYGYDPNVYHERPSHNGSKDMVGLDGTPAKHPHHRGHKHQRRDSDSDSELSAMEHPDLDLASSHSSDDDDDDDGGFAGGGWGKFKNPPPYLAVPNPRTLTTPGAAPGGATNHSRSATPDMQQIYPRPRGVTDSPRGTRGATPQSRGGGGRGSTTTPKRVGFSRPPTAAADSRNSQSPTSPTAATGVTTPNGQAGSRDVLVPPERTDSLPSSSKSSKVDTTSPKSPRQRIAVKVLTHNGSITSDSENSQASHETSV